MSAHIGDRIRQHSNTVDVPDRVGTIVAVLGGDGPPYRVRFDSGEETIVSPGPDAVIEPGSLTERAGVVGEKAKEKAKEKASEAVETAREAGTDATGRVARAVSEAADDVARRLER